MPASTPPVVSVRLSPDQFALVAAGAEQARTNLSDYIRRKALEGAEIDVLERRVVTIPAADWEKFEAWLDRPAETIPALQELARRAPSWAK